MNISYACLPSLYSLYFANYCIRKKKINIKLLMLSEKTIVIHQKPLNNFMSLFYLIHFFGLKYTGFLISQLFFLGVLQLISNWVPAQYRLMTFHELEKHFDTEIVNSNDFNSPQVVEKIKESNIDILLSNGCNQIFKNDLINAPKVISVNIHGSILPDDRGVDPLFQRMLRNEPYLALTLHKLTEKIDDGDILHSITEPIHTPKTYFDHLIKQSILSGDLFAQYLSTHPIDIRAQSQLPIQHHYKSWPTKKEIHQFHQLGKRFLSIKTLINSLKFNLHE